MMKKAKLLLVSMCMCIGLSACAKENENQEESITQKQRQSVVDSGFDEVDISEKMNVYLVEPIKTVDQIASDEESQNVIQIISQLSVDDFTTALVYDSTVGEHLADNKVVLLFQSESDNIKIYGYKGIEYGARGVITCFNGEYSYFDIAWFGKFGEMEFYEQDYDYDGISEIAFCFEGASGTGVEIYRLVMFDDVERSGKLEAYEFTPEMQMEQFENKMSFIVDMESKTVNVSKEGVTETTIDWERYEDMFEENNFGIDCLNQITFDFSGNEIKMCVGVGILMNQGDPTIFFEVNEGDKLCLDLLYKNGVYEIS